MRSILAAIMVFVAFPSQSEDMIWIGKVVDGEASLLFGLPESGIIDFYITCREGTSRVDFTYSHEPDRAKEGMNVPVRLSAGGRSIQIDTVGARLEVDDEFALEGVTTLNDDLIAIFSAKGAMKVSVGGKTFSYPLKGAKNAMSDLLKTCRKA